MRLPVDVAVPSHARATTCNTATLKILADRGVPRERVRVFVAPSERDVYRRGLDPALYAEVFVGGDGVAAQRNAIAQFYPEGALVVMMDDDVRDVRQRVSARGHEPVVDLGPVFERGFRHVVQAGVGLWGVYPTLNPFYMSNRVRVGLYFCIGQLTGCINTRQAWAQLHLEQKDDYERTLRWFERYGGVVRLDNLACESPLYGPGGLQAGDRPDRAAVNAREVTWLLQTWPELVRPSPRTSRVGAEVRLAPLAQRHLRLHAPPRPLLLTRQEATSCSSKS
jgi:hypothetical protein